MMYWREELVWMESGLATWSSDRKDPSVVFRWGSPPLDVDSGNGPIRHWSLTLKAPSVAPLTNSN